MRTRELEKGFTLIEMLFTIAILAALISISTLSYNCTMYSIDRDEARNNSTSIQASLEEYYYDRGIVPLGKAIDYKSLETKVLSELDSYVSTLGLNMPNTASYYIKSGKLGIYEIDASKLKTKGKISNDTFGMYYILYSTDKATNQAYSKLNRTILAKRFYNTCNSQKFVAKVALQRTVKASEQLEYEMTEEYIKTPNKDLSNMLDQ